MEKDKHTDTPKEVSQKNRGTETNTGSDPQERMEGPVSSLMHETGEAFDTKETREQAEEERDRKL